MDQETEKIIREQMEKLPEEIRSLFADPALGEKISKIGGDNGLNQDQINVLITETYLVLLGLSEINEYGDLLRNTFPKDSAELIILEVNESIFEKILPQLIDAYYDDVPGNDTNQYNFENSDEKLQNLPKEVRDAISDSKYQEKLYRISSERKLNVEQMGILEENVVNVMIGSISSEEFSQIVRNKLGLSQDETGRLINEINERILKSVREKIMASGTTQTNFKQSTAQLDKADTQVLHGVGIKILPDLTTPELASGNVHPMLAQKFSGTFQVPTVKTEHKDIVVTEKKAAPVTPPTPKNYAKGSDPYRELPE